MRTKKIKKSKDLVYPISIPEDEVKDAVKRGLLDPMLDRYLKMARDSMLRAIEEKNVS